MKPFIFFLFITLFFFSLTTAHSQTWEWKWGGLPSVPPYNASFATPVFTDHSGAIYAIYESQISAEISAFDNNGNFIRAIPIASTNGMIFEVKAGADTTGNLYIAVSHQGNLFLLDTILPHSDLNDPFVPEMVIIQIGADQKIKWTRRFPCTSQTTVHELLVTQDQNILVAELHMAQSGWGPQRVISFGDTLTFNINMQLLHKIDPSGNQVWQKKIKGTYISQLAIMKEDPARKIWLIDFCDSDIYEESDTIPFPQNPVNPWNVACLIHYDTDGNYLDGNMLNDGIYYNDISFDQLNNPYLTGSFQHAFLGGDSLVAPADSIGTIVYLSDQNQGISWKKTYITKYYSSFSISPDGNNLYFAANLPQHATIFGQPVTFIGAEGVMTGSLDHNGNLLQYTLSPVFYKFRQDGILRENCGNIVMGANYEGWGIIGNDTLPSSQGSACIAFLQTQTPVVIGLPSDTSGCGSLVLRIPPEFTHFNWNNGLSTADSLVVTQTGIYTIAAMTADYCPAYDTIIVIIREEPGDILGNDLSISRNDSIIFQIPFVYQTCTWSTGDTTGSITLYGSDLGTGTHTVWVNVVAPPCNVTDSVKITVLPGQGTNDINSMEQWFYPNPARDKIYISATGRKSNLVLLNAQGKMVKSYSLTHEKDEVRVIELDDVPPGMYFLVEQSGQTLRRGKIVIK